MKRILVIGRCGAGKSVFSQQLANRLNIPVTHLDRLHWKSPTSHTAPDEFDRRLQKVLNQPTWIIDGTYFRTLPQRLKHADTVIQLDYPLPLSLWRAVRRYIKSQRHLPEPVAAGNPPRFRFAFLMRILTFPRHKILGLVKEANVRGVCLHTPAASKIWLESLKS